MKGPSRLLLILLLLPVLVLGVWLAVQDVWLPVHDWDVSPDGSLLVALINHDRRRMDASGGSTVVWDLTSRRRIAKWKGQDAIPGAVSAPAAPLTHFASTVSLAMERGHQVVFQFNSR